MTGAGRMRRILCTASASLLTAAMPSASPGQELPAPSAFVDPGHWSEITVRRLAALGVVTGSEALQAWPVSTVEVADYLNRHLPERPRRSSAARGIVATRFLEEQAALPTASSPSASVRLRGGWAGGRGDLLGGAAVRDAGGAWSYPGPNSAANLMGERAEVAVDMAWHAVHASVNAERLDSQMDIRNAHLGVAFRSVDIWLGREALRFGPGYETSVVLDAPASMIGAGLRTRSPLNLPGFLRGLGTVRGTVVLSRMSRSGTVDAPWFTAARLTLSPNPGLVIGLNRAAIFGGRGNVEDVSIANIALMTLGVTGYLGKDSGFENQVASLDFWARSRMGGVPYAVYGELGVDDVGLRLWGAPAVIVGMELPELPGVNELGLGLEYTRIFGSCCGKPPWYRHGDLGEGWTDRGHLLGHSLGGHGSQLSLNWTTWPIGAVTHLDGSLFLRRRGEENLFAPDWRGGSYGTSVRGVIRAALAVRVLGGVRVERGWGDWQVWTAEMAAEVSFGNP